MLLAGDIGATKTQLALYTREAGARDPAVEAEFRSADYPGLEEMAREFMTRAERPVKAACFDVAGPVIGGRARLTNLPWQLDETALAGTLGLDRVILLNDLKAIAYAVPHLLPEELHTINEGTAEAEAPLAVIAPGTGLGEAYLVWDGKAYVACSSEGGHADFAPADRLQAELWAYLAERHGHVAYERVCSGSGLPNIYDFLRDTGRGTEAPAFAAALAKAADRTPIIMRAAQEDPTNVLSVATLDLFVAIFGAEAGNLALKLLATGGVYLAGGLPPRILDRLGDGRFMQAFQAKGRFADLLGTIPVKVITNRAALLGAALYGLDRMARAAR
jgi:glucokinase